MHLFRRFVKLAGSSVLIPLVKYYLRQDRNYSCKGISIKVLSGVFHPGLYFSTRVLMNYIGRLDLTGRTFLELGAGTGLISLFAAKKGAIVCASDISPRAILNLQLNAALNNLPITILSSDLFDNFPAQTFDFMAIQPPFYPKDPVTFEDYAWYCGREFDFYRKLFRQLENFRHPQSQIFMILSDDCEIESIKQIAVSNGFGLRKVFEKKVLWEWNFIFGIFQLTEAE